MSIITAKEHKLSTQTMAQVYAETITKLMEENKILWNWKQILEPVLWAEKWMKLINTRGN